MKINECSGKVQQMADILKMKKTIEKIKIRDVFRQSKSTEIDPFVDMGDKMTVLP